MSSLPSSKRSVLPLAIALQARVIAVGATQLPLKDLRSCARRLPL
jgi:hypothetical protein